ncbi:MAG: DUF1634 domain-containing protein [Nitrospinae bacterium]|nr:DUF1634 domain-containing protein [Nitrospinota bacterium]
MDFHPDAVERAAVIESVQTGNAQSGTITDQKVRSIELLISGLLRGGALASLVFIFAGALLIFIDHPNYLRSPEKLHQLLLPGAIFPHTIADVGREVLQLRGPALVMVGLLLLIVTPVLLVAVSILMFAYQRDRDFVMITFLVLMLLVTSFLLGTTEHSPTSAPANQRGKGMDVKVGSAVGSGQWAENPRQIRGGKG